MDLQEMVKLSFIFDSLTEVFVKAESPDNIKTNEQYDNKISEDAKPNIQTPSYIDNGPPPYTEKARMARYIVHYSGRLRVQVIRVNFVRCKDTKSV